MHPSEDHSSRLLSLIVHELRAPAGVVSGYLRLLMKSGAARLSDSERRIVEDAAKCCTRLLRVLQEVDDFTDLGDPARFQELSPVPVFSVCEEAVREATPGGSLTFECSSGDRPALVRGESLRLKQAFAALVALTVREHGALPVEIVGFVSRDGSAGSAVVAFGDPGLGGQHDQILAAREIEFDRWRGGMGLVVPIASRIVEFHGGRVWGLPGQSRAACAISLPLASA